MKRYWFHVKNHFRNFHHIFTFWDHLSQKKWFLQKSGARPKQYPLNSKQPCFLARQWPRNCVSIISGSLPMGAVRRTSALFCPACMPFIRDLSKASYLGVPPERNRPVAYSVLRRRHSIAASLCRSPQRVPPRRTSVDSCSHRAPGNPPPCGQSQDCKTAIAAVALRLSPDPTADPRAPNVSRLEQHQGARFLQSDDSLLCASKRPLRHRHLHFRWRFLLQAAPDCHTKLFTT